MSFKSKDLTYDKSQPAFLRRLRGEISSDDSARHERPTPRNKRMKQDDEDDAPTYVLEDTNQSLSKEEYEAFITGKDPDKKGSTEEGMEDERREREETKPKEKIVEVGKASKKRKVGKVIGEEQGEQHEEKEKGVKESEKVVKKAKKKAKAVKLTFGDE